MHRSSRTAAIAFLLLCTADAKDPSASEDNWIELTDQPARKQLFENVVRASLMEDSRQQNPTLPTEFAIPKDFVFPDDARVDKINKVDRNAVIFGIDVSHHDGEAFDLTALRLQKIDFVYVKATQGTKFKDRRFADYWRKLGDLGPSEKPLRGAYHFLSATEDGKTQAERFVQYINLHGGLRKDDMPPCLDLEWDIGAKSPDQWKGQSPDEILSKVAVWLNRVKELTGRTPLIYTARSWWLERDIPESKLDLLKDYPIWLADYSRSHKASEKPAVINGRAQSLWQFADDAMLRVGYPGKLDANIFYGSRADFEKAFGIAR